MREGVVGTRRPKFGESMHESTEPALARSRSCTETIPILQFSCIDPLQIGRLVPPTPARIGRHRAPIFSKIVGLWVRCMNATDRIRDRCSKRPNEGGYEAINRGTQPRTFDRRRLGCVPSSCRCTSGVDKRQLELQQLKEVEFARRRYLGG